MQNILMYQDDERIMELVNEANSHGAAVIFNDVSAVDDYLGMFEAIDLSTKTLAFLDGQTSTPVGIFSSVLDSTFKPNFIYLASKWGQVDLAILVIAHELGHLLKIKEASETMENYVDEYVYDVHNYIQELDAWMYGFNFLIQNKIKINYFETLEGIIWHCLKSHDDEMERINNQSFGLYPFCDKEEILSNIINQYKEVVING